VLSKSLIASIKDIAKAAFYPPDN